MLDLTQAQDLMPKDLLQFVERRAERAVEVLREILELPEEASNISLAQFQAMQSMAANSTNATVTGWGTGTGLMGLGQAVPMQVQTPFNQGV